MMERDKTFVGVGGAVEDSFGIFGDGKVDILVDFGVGGEIVETEIHGGGVLELSGADGDTLATCVARDEVFEGVEEIALFETTVSKTAIGAVVIEGIASEGTAKVAASKNQSDSSDDDGNKIWKFFHITP